MRKALYRKYRSTSLSEIIGQEHITSVLQESIKNKTPNHAYLFIGPRGTGKTSIARILAHAVNDFTYKIEDQHLDIIEIDAASNTGVDNIRELREKAIIAPSKGKYKVYIIDEVHMLSKSAFNALLKTLEEPPAHVIFIMATTDAHKVPITITSRSQVFTFKLADSDTMLKYLRNIATAENIKINDEALKIIAKRGGGSFRDSISLLDQISSLSNQEIDPKLINQALGLPSKELVTDLLNAYSDKNLSEITKLLKILHQQGTKPGVIAEELINTILLRPDIHYLELLDSLTEINRAAHPEVKLLLAFTKPMIAPLQPTASHTAKQAKTKIVDTTNTVAVPKIKKTAPPEVVKNTASTPLNSSSSDQLWQQLLDSINKEKTSIHSHLAQCEYLISDQKITLYANKPFYKTQLEKHKDLLLQNLPDTFDIEILAASKASNTPLINTIADIMGGGEEINVNEWQ